MSTGATRGHEGQPLVVGDTMYYESAFPNHVYAVNLDDYSTKWEFTPKEDPFALSVACCDLVNRGVAYGDGKIIVDALDGNVYALDAASGKTIWHVKHSDPEMGQTLTSAPLVVKDKVLVGVSGGEYGVRGYLTSYNMNTGKQVWRAYSEGPDSDVLIGSDFTGPKNAGRSTWHADQWRVGGGTTWGWYSYDPALDLIYYGTGNPGTWNPSQRLGDNKWSMTIFARNPDTGMAKWAYQMTPHDAWDFDGVECSHFFALHARRFNDLHWIAEKNAGTNRPPAERRSWAAHCEASVAKALPPRQYCRTIPDTEASCF
jgi:PQQ-dependent dehydrogenase (methanol/ethanol family)